MFDGNIFPNGERFWCNIGPNGDERFCGNICPNGEILDGNICPNGGMLDGNAVEVWWGGKECFWQPTLAQVLARWLLMMISKSSKQFEWNILMDGWDRDFAFFILWGLIMIFEFFPCFSFKKKMQQRFCSFVPVSCVHSQDKLRSHRHLITGNEPICQCG